MSDKHDKDNADENPTPAETPTARRVSTTRLQVISFLIEYEKRLKERNTPLSVLLVEESQKLRSELQNALTREHRDEIYTKVKDWNKRAVYILSQK